MSRRTGKTAYRKDILRTITGSARRFFALALIAVLGTMMYSGLQASCQDLRVSAEEFFDGQKLHDIEILSTMGLTDDDVDALLQLEQVGAAEGVFRADVSVTLPARTGDADADRQSAEGSIQAELQTITTAGTDAPYILDGRLPQAADETAVTQKFLADSGFELGDTIHVTAEEEKGGSNSENSAEDEEDEDDDDWDEEYGDDSSYTLNETDLVIVGIVTDVTNMNNPFGPTSFRGDVDDKGKIYVTRDAVEADYWTAIPVVLKESEELFSFSGEYKAYVRGVKDYLEDEIRAQRESARYEQLRGDALKKLADKEKEAYDELADAEKELLDGEQELKDKQEEGEQELLDGRRELDRKLADARAELEDGRRELDEKLAKGLQELADGRKELDEKLADAWQELADAEWKLQQGYDQWHRGVEDLENGEREAEQAFAKAHKDLEDGKKELEENQKKLDAAAAEIEAGEQQLEEGKAALTAQQEETEASLSGGIAQLEAGIGELEAGIAEIDRMIEELRNLQAGANVTATEGSGDSGGTVPGAGEDSGEALPGDGEDSGETPSGEDGDSGETPPEGGGGEDIEARIAELMQQREGLEAQLQDLQAQLAGLKAQKDEAEAGFEAAWAEIAKKEQELSAGKAEIEAGFKELEAGREELKAGEEELAKQEEETARKLEEGRRELEEGKLELDRNQYKVNEGWREYEEGRQEGEQKLADGYTEYMDGKAEGEQKLADGWREYEEGRQEGEQKLADGRKELEEGVAEGRQELDDGWKEYEEGKQEAEEKLGDARKKIDEIDMAEWYIQDRTALSGYVNIGSDADSIESIGTVFPVVFFIVAFLMSLTTVTRMVEEDRGLIGTYKALGFTNREIRRKYLVYTAAAGILGSAGGTAAAFLALPAFIFTIFRKMYLLPFYRFTFTPLFGISGPLVFFIGILGAAVLACRGELRQVPAALMRPKAPRLGSGILLEKVSLVWDRLSFLQKVTARNLFRYKKRMFMTVFGIGGCMALLLFGFAIRDSVHDLMPRQYEETTVYDILAVSLPEDLAELQELVRTQTADGEAGMLALMVTTGAVRTEDGEELSEQIFVIPDVEDISPYIHLIPAKERTTELHGTAEGGTVERGTDEGGTELQLSDGMIAFTQNASSVLGFREGDDVELRTVDLKKAVVPAGVIVKNYLGNSVFMNAATYRKYFAEPENNAVLVKLSGMDREEAFSAYERIRENDIVVSSVSRGKTMGQFEDAFILINAVVYIVILMSAALAFVVLFTLSLTNISEREREMATIKVLGFYDYEVHSYINRETFILTGIGIAAGIPLGYAFAQTLTAILNLPSIYLAVSLHRSSYLMAAGLTILFAILVSLITNRMLDRINPVEALKSVE